MSRYSLDINQLRTLGQPRDKKSTKGNRTQERPEIDHCSARLLSERENHARPRNSAKQTSARTFAELNARSERRLLRGGASGRGSRRDPRRRFDFRAAARRGGQADAEPASIARFLAFFSEARERAPRPWRMECGRGESRRVPARVARGVHGMAWHGYGYIRVLARIRRPANLSGAHTDSGLPSVRRAANFLLEAPSRNRKPRKLDRARRRDSRIAFGEEARLG